MKKALIWDLDGTLVDSYRLIVNHVTTLFEPYEALDYEETHKAVTHTSILDFLKMKCKQHGLDLETIGKKYVQQNENSRPEEHLLMPNTIEVLSHFKALGYEHYIYTHRGISTYAILEAHNIKDWFVDIVTREDGFKRKPDPDALLHLIHKHDIDTKISYYIGDRLLDVQCGAQASLRTAFVDSNNLGDIVADIAVKDLISLKNKIK